MTPRERVLAALAGEMPDRVPFVVWNNKLPGEPVNSRLFECEACVINKSTVYRLSTPGVEVETEQLAPIDCLARRRKIFHTPAGDLITEERIVPGSIWLEKMPFTGPNDYEPLEAFISSKAYTACYDKFVADENKYGEQSLARPETIYTPIQDLICKYMGVEVFCIEWADRRDRLLKLCETIAEDRRRRLELVASSPARFVVIEGNVITEVTGPERFEKYHIPYIEEACELLHNNGKYAGALSLSEARRLWPDKTIQINFPSSVHLAGPEAVQKAAAQILKEAAPGDRFIVGVSEDISEGGVNTLVPLAQAVFDNGRTPIPAN
jgi:hypothetical protein